MDSSQTWARAAEEMAGIVLSVMSLGPLMTSVCVLSWVYLVSWESRNDVPTRLGLATGVSGLIQGGITHAPPTPTAVGVQMMTGQAAGEPTSWWKRLQVPLRRTRSATGKYERVFSKTSSGRSTRVGCSVMPVGGKIGGSLDLAGRLGQLPTRTRGGARPRLLC